MKGEVLPGYRYSANKADTPPAYKKWFPIIGGAIIHLTLGSLHCFGNLTLYTTSYVRANGSDIRYKDSSWVYAAAVVGQGFFGFFGGRLEQTMGAKWATLLGGWIMSLGVILSYFTVNSFAGFFLTYGLLNGIGSGLCYPVPLSCAMKWAPDMKGLVSGVIFFGRGLSAFIFTPMQTAFVNPNDLTPDFAPFEDRPGEKYFTDPEVLDRVPSLFIFLGVIFAGLQLVGSLMLIDPPADDAESSASSSSPDSRGEILKHSSDNVVLTPTQIFRSGPFWVLWAMMFLNWQAVAFTQAFWKVIGAEEVGLKDSKLATLGSIAAIANSLGRVGWGYGGDYFGFKASMVSMSVLMTIFIGTLTIAGSFGFGAYALWICIVFSSHGGAFAIFPSVTADIFGKTNFGPVFGLLFSARACASVLNSFAAQHLIQTFGHFGMCVVVSACTGASLFLALGFAPQRKVTAPHE
eukprot:GHVU01154264.1.p1 GENE.GHVU01154264.1~~GHVU01154264.1.p1  ORF type:complete len:462 (-),score=81.78 GHVU01154264.1:695-2080(-)